MIRKNKDDNLIRLIKTVIYDFFQIKKINHFNFK